MLVAITTHRLWHILFYSLLLAVLVLSLLPIDHPDVSPNDKVNHFIAYGSLCLVGYLAHRRRIPVFATVFAFGALVEVLQGLTGYRFMSGADIIANGFGALLGLILSYLIKETETNNEPEEGKALK